MQTLRAVLTAGLAASTWLVTVAQRTSPPDARAIALAREAVAAEPVAARAARATLRAQGQAGVDALLSQRPSADDDARPRWEAALDAVCAQRDCSATGLFWHTDLEAAKAEAARTRRPILSLRLLGRLDEEVSCANSRFFRTLLYPDPRVSGALRRRFVLHWQSVRPVPRLTIDFGDGRRLDGTITGNSAHLVLDSRGRLVDALPGLYGPGMFLQALTDAERVATAAAKLDDQPLDTLLANFHFDRLVAVESALGPEGGLAATYPLAPQAAGEPPSAAQAVPLAETKAVFEAPVVAAVSNGVPTRAERAITQPVPLDWSHVAGRFAASWELGPESRRLAVAKQAARGGDVDPAFFTALERSVGFDTVRNEFLLHSWIHQRLANSQGPVDVMEFQEWLYGEVFLTPSRDPWLGLLTPQTYLALAPTTAPSVPQVDLGD